MKFTGTVACQVLLLVAACSAQVVSSESYDGRPQFGMEPSSIIIKNNLLKSNVSSMETIPVFGKEMQTISIDVDVSDDLKALYTEQLKSKSFGKESEVARIHVSK